MAQYDFPKPIPKFFTITSLDQVIPGNDTYLIDASTIESINAEAENDCPPFRVLYSVIESKASACFNIEIILDHYNRAHTYKDKLPLGDVIFYTWGENNHLYLFITPERYKSFYRRVFSSFALIDLIGVREVIDKNSPLLSKIKKLPEIIDRFAHNNPEVFFFSFADTVWLKSNWKYFKTKNYDPENFLRLIIKFQACLEQETGLKSYSIITQGSNLYGTEKTHHINQNHVSLLTLGIPFETLYKIDDYLKSDAGKSIRSEIYLEASFFRSLNFWPKNQFKPTKFDDVEFFTVGKDILNCI